MSTPATLRRALSIAAEHPALAGHFPGRPIVPGVVLLDEVLRALSSEAPRPASGWRLDVAKFHQVVRPDEPLELQIELAEGPCRFSVRRAGSPVLTGSVTSIRAAAPAPVSPWRVNPERGSRVLLGWMATVSLRVGRAVSRCLLYPIALYYFLFAPAARACMLQYLQRALGRPARARDRLRLIMSFASSIHDRLFLLAGREELFDISVQGEEIIAPAIASGGAFLMGAHVGSFEVLRLIGRRKAGLAVAMAMYEDNARKLNAVLGAVAAPDPPEIIAVGQVDSVLRIHSSLEQGRLVGVLADRRLGEEPALSVPFLGAPALFPTNPLRLAAALRRRVVFMLGLYRGSNRYHVVFEPLADFSSTLPAERSAAIEAAVRRYAALLERYCRSEPYNWFNFFDFWEAAATGETIGPARAAETP